MLIYNNNYNTKTLAINGGQDCQPGRAESLAGELDYFRDYLTLVARRELAPDLAAKVGASDLVQETFLAAGRDISQFAGGSPSDLRRWLEGILRHLLCNTRRRYRQTRKRRVDREVMVHGGSGKTREDRVATVSVSMTSPSGRAMKEEREVALRAALLGLPEHYRQVIEWHHQERLSFDTIAERIGSSSEAARKIWGRALLRLRAELGPGYDPR
jgi:RNA polymerase sigma-70 factor (ECF subfamily)